MFFRSVGTSLWSMSRKRVDRVNTISREITELEILHFTYRIMAFKDSDTYQRGAHFIKPQPIVDIFVCFKWSLRKPWLLIQREIEDIRARARKVCYQQEPKTVFSWQRSAGNYFSFLREQWQWDKWAKRVPGHYTTRKFRYDDAIKHPNQCT